MIFLTLRNTLKRHDKTSGVALWASIVPPHLKKVWQSVPLMTLCLAISGPVFAGDIYAIDGDTIVMSGEHVRILNIDAPEIGHPKCDAELRLGLVAKRRMQALIEGGAVTLQRGDNGRMKDRYGRTLARVIVNGQDAGERLISEGLARRWDGARHPWCEGN